MIWRACMSIGQIELYEYLTLRIYNDFVFNIGIIDLDKNMATPR